MGSVELMILCLLLPERAFKIYLLGGFKNLLTIPYLLPEVSKTPLRCDTPSYLKLTINLYVSPHTYR